MLLSEIFDHLHYSELSLLFEGGNSDTGIREIEYPKIISSINLGLIDLYKKFSIRENFLTLQSYSDINLYSLEPKYAENSNSLEPVKYIIDSIADPFIDKVLQIESIEVSAKKPYLIGLNNRTSVGILGEYNVNPDTLKNSVYIRNQSTFHVALPDDTTKLFIRYRAYPDKISTAETEIGDINISLPDQLVSALLAFVGYRAYLPMGGGETSKSQEYLTTYAFLCSEAKRLGTITTDEHASGSFVNNGWV